MSTKKTIKEQVGAPAGADAVVEMSPELTAVLDKLADKLDKLDVSIDYLTAAITGEDPLSISIGQFATGRFAAPPRPAAKIEEAKKTITDISESSLLHLIRKELKTVLNEGVSSSDAILEDPWAVKKGSIKK